ncbi:YdeI/OmpD-associated family protein [uncultured Imperialibacter sp.]|uniref:YdeI/OmpD-associated family protein n=1 Tax=uncultured Imperialibacter sp. TaxID=1672639 RepID=UPI0030D6DE76|tara:strand:+ start:957 stop:1415 length:459 start_codon:yes stop_codon:yes gene_type:complete
MSGSKQTFQTTILQTGNNTGIPVPAEIVEALGAGKKPLVVVTVNDYTYRSAIATMGGKFMISFSSAHRAASGLAGGDKVKVTLEVDTAPRTVEVPEDLQKALDAQPALNSKFEGLSNSKKKLLVLPIEDAKTEETRARRVEKAIQMLEGGKI